MYLDRFWWDVCCRYTGNKVILVFQERSPSEWVHTHTQNMPNTAHTAARERRSQGQTAGHTQLALRASTSLSPWEVTGALGCQQKEKKKIKNSCWSTFLLLNHEINTHVPSSEQIRLSQNLQSPEHCPDQTGALFSAREHFLQGWALCWQHQILSGFHYLSKLTPQVTRACDKTSVNPSMASSDPYFVLSSLVEVTLPQQGQVCPLHSCV